MTYWAESVIYRLLLEKFAFKQYSTLQLLFYNLVRVNRRYIGFREILMKNGKVCKKQYRFRFDLCARKVADKFYYGRILLMLRSRNRQNSEI